MPSLGEVLQFKVLFETHSTIAPSLIGPSPSPATVWMTPPSRYPRYNIRFMQNTLQRTLASFPGRLRAPCVHRGVLCFRVANQNVANILAMVGAIHFGSTVLFLHGSLAAAMAAFERLPFSLEEEDEVTLDGPSHLPRLPVPVVSVAGVKSLQASARISDVRTHLGSVPLRLLNAPTSAFMGASLPSAGEASSHLVAPMLSEGLASSVNGHKLTYLQVALTPARPAPSTPKPPKPILATDVCFRCLSPDHLVKDCRDPVHCRRCLRSSHRQPVCPMKLSSLLSLGRNRSPTIPMPASRRSVHAVPYKPRRADARLRNPPPNSPELARVPRLPLPFYDERFMVPSSSSEVPDFELVGGRPAPQILRSAPNSRPQDMFIIGGSGKEVHNRPPSPDVGLETSRSPPPTPSPLRIPVAPTSPPRDQDNLYSPPHDPVGLGVLACRRYLLLYPLLSTWPSTPCRSRCGIARISLMRRGT